MVDQLPHVQLHNAGAPEIVAANLPVLTGACGIFGHSMGGHGALTIALRNPSQYKSVSAFAPIAAPMQCPWGQKAFNNYLGADQQAWREYDATELVARKAFSTHILIDQGTGDQYLHEHQLLPENFRQPQRNRVRSSRCACRTDTITAITSCKPSWPII